MALKITHQFSNGLQSTDSYARINRYICMHEPENKQVYIEVKVYSSQEALINNKDGEVLHIDKAFNDEEISLSSLYLYLKTLPQFANAIDV